jgi:hypothetical protein
MEKGINLTTGLSGASYEVTGSFSLTVQDGEYGYKSELQAMYDNTTFSDQWAKVSFTQPVRMPMDNGRVIAGEFTDETLYNVTIISCTDSALVVAVERIKEVDGKASHCRLLYSYICDDYTYTYDDPDQAETITYSAPVKTTFTASDLVGTWKYDSVPMGWIKFTQTGDQGTSIPAYLYEEWNTRSDVETTLISWGIASIDSAFVANDSHTYVFNNDGTCVLNGVSNTYNVTNGEITFGTTSLTNEFSISVLGTWFNITFTGSTIYAIDVNNYGSTQAAYTYNGIWLGQKNGDVNEYKAIHLVKQTVTK